jgi:hypothetical protein
VEYIFIEKSLTFSASSWPIIPTHDSKSMFSSCSPCSAFVEGVKIGV